MLTGEAAPVMKVRVIVFCLFVPSRTTTIPICPTELNPTLPPTHACTQASLPPGDATLFRPASERDKKYVLFSGTKVLQARCGPLPRLPQHKALPLEESKYVWETVVEAPKQQQQSGSGSGCGPSPTHSSHGRHPTLRGLAELLQHQQRYQKPIAVGMVMRTGFSTARGQLVRAILFPPPPKFDFEAQVGGRDDPST